MTSQADILDNPNYLPVLDHGFVGVREHMGSDTAVVQAARVSYGEGTKSVREDRALIRYLFRHQHSSPIEMAVVKFHIRCPIFVMRQIGRHRTASTNEYSGRYSVMADEFYLPDLDAIQPQSTANRQGRGGDISSASKLKVQRLIKWVYEYANDAYRLLLGERNGEPPFDAHDDDPLDADFPGVARELSRVVLPVGNYTECYWKIDLSNLFKFLKLRMDREHAQGETAWFAEAMYQLIEPLFPHCCEAFEDYNLHAYTLSRMEVNLVRSLLNSLPSDGLDVAAAKFGLTKREAAEFRTHLYG